MYNGNKERVHQDRAGDARQAGVYSRVRRPFGEQPGPRAGAQQHCGLRARARRDRRRHRPRRERQAYEEISPRAFIH